MIKKFVEYSKNEFDNFKIFQDMDGCLTDFESRFIEMEDNFEDLDPSEYEHKYGKNKMWELINSAGVKWWSEMEWMVDGEELWNFIKNYDPIILSAPSRDKSSIIGKIEWIKNNLLIDQEYPTVSPKASRWSEDSKVILNSQKYLFVNRYENSILIDDTEKQVNNWIDKGGIGILHTSSKNTIKQLKTIINNIF